MLLARDGRPTQKGRRLFVVKNIVVVLYKVENSIVIQGWSILS